MVDDPLWIGVDIGTQSVRVLVVDAWGVPHGQASRPLTSRRDAERHEQDPGEWWWRFTEAARQAVSTVDPRRIAGLAIDSTSGTILLADPGGTPLTPGLMYDDARAVAETGPVNDAGAEIWSVLGYQRMQPSWALPTLLWLRGHGAVSSEVRLLHQADFLVWKLAGRRLPTDTSHALKTGYHLLDGRWPTEILDELALPECILPEVTEPGTVLGVVCEAASAVSGIPAGTSIVAGMTDGCAAQLGAGSLEIGSWNSVLGTTLVLKGVSCEPVRDPGGVVYSHRGAQQTWLPGGASSSGAGAIARMLPGADVEALTRQAVNRRPSAVVYPLSSERGERFPCRAPDLTSFVLGAVEDEVDVFQGVLIGVACVERLCFDYLDLLGAPLGGRYTLTGGAAGNRYWSQLRATLLGRSVRVPDRSGSAWGMAMLAATSDGTSLPDVVERMASRADTIDPVVQGGSLFDLYGRFVDQLVDCGWVEQALAAHARRNLERDG